MSVERLTVSLLMPTYNEAGHIRELIEEASAALAATVPDYEIIVVDDDSADRTWEIAGAAANDRVRVIRRMKEHGLTASLREGIAASRHEVIAWMDCDFSHPPGKIPQLLFMIGQGYDVVVNSRYVSGGGEDRVGKGSASQMALSFFLNWGTRFLLRSSFADYTSGFVAVRRRVLDRIALRGDYGEYFIDFVYRSIREKFKVCEMPYVALPRRSGSSKTGSTLLDYMDRGKHYLSTVARLKWEDLTGRSEPGDSSRRATGDAEKNRFRGEDSVPAWPMQIPDKGGLAANEPGDPCQRGYDAMTSGESIQCGDNPVQRDPAGADNAALAFILRVTLILAAVLLFAQLGHYALWDDEAIDALMARSVLNTGDTGGVDDDGNIIGYRNGFLLNKLRVEGEPPLTAYLVALSFGLFGETSWAARLPAATFGLAAVGLMLWWMWRLRVSPLTASMFCIALLLNVPFLLFARQCHYYGIAMFCVLAIVYSYLYWQGKNRMLLAMGICSSLLLSANYAFHVILYSCLLADYLIWQRRERPFGFRDLAVLFAPQILMGLAMLFWWNPFHTQLGHRLAVQSLGDRITLFFWHWRDLNSGELFVGIVMVLAPCVAIFCKDKWLKRALFALFLYAVGLTLISAQSVKNTSLSDVRYFSAIIPLFILIQILTIRGLTRSVPWLAIPATLLIFGSNLLNGGPLLASGLRSTFASFVGELANPPGDPYTASGKWIAENVGKGESIWVLPDYMTSPLIFHAPKALYAWQLHGDNRDPQFAALPAIHFRGRMPPDFIIAFGPSVQTVRELMKKWADQGARYVEAATLDSFWKDAYRPELALRTFRTIKNYDKSTEAIYIFKRI